MFKTVDNIITESGGLSRRFRNLGGAILLLFLLPVFFTWGQAISHFNNEELLKREYEVKAAFIYNFLKFVSCPEEQEQKKYMVGVYGRLASQVSSQVFSGKTANNLPIEVIELKSSDLKDSKRTQICSVVYISMEYAGQQKDILGQIKGKSILSIGEDASFMREGGIINFLIEDKKVRFDINLDAAEEAKIEIRAKLLRLARKVFYKQKEQKQN